LRSFFKRSLDRQDFITVVSGLPRSGTSMMMSALKAGGLTLLTDEIRTADANNPKGYLEYERVKRLPEGDTEWLKEARGKVVKVISPLLAYFPDKYSYKVIFMERELNEILSSQARMLEQAGKQNQRSSSDEEVRISYQRHLEDVQAWLADQDRMDTLYVSYNRILRQPLKVFREVGRFLNGRVSPKLMTQVVDENLYRERN